MPSAPLDRDERSVFRPDVIGAGADDLAVLALFDDVRGPAGDARHHEDRREHRGGDAHEVISDCRKSVQIGKHFPVVSPLWRGDAVYVMEVLYSGYAGRLYGCSRLITSGTSNPALTGDVKRR